MSEEGSRIDIGKIIEERIKQSNFDERVKIFCKKVIDYEKTYIWKERKRGYKEEYEEYIDEILKREEVK